MTTNQAADRPRDARGRFVSASSTGSDIAVLERMLGEVQTDNFRLSEALGNIQMMIDSQGWSPVWDHSEDGGLRLSDLKGASEQLRELVVGNPLMKQGSETRNARIWGEGLDFFTISTSGRTSDLPARVKAALLKPRNQRYLMSADARHEMERAAFTDGNIFMLYMPGTETFMRVPMSQITADWRSPDNPEEVWAYRRQWMKDITKGSVAENLQTEWYYTDIFDERRQSWITYDGKREKANLTATMVDVAFNRQTGWAYGVPDSLPALAWSKLYKEFLVNGYVMSRALAQIAFKATAATNAARDAAAVDIAKPGQGGGTATMTQGTDLLPLATAGKGYDFDSGRPLAAMIAASLGLSIGTLLGDAEKESESFDRVTNAMAVMRRQTWAGFWQRIMRLLGVQQQVGVAWHDIREEQLQRVIQSWVLANSTGLFAPDPMQEGIARAIGLAVPGAVPDGYLIPNNAESLPRKDIDAEKPGDAPNDQDDPDQGRMPSAGSGQGQDAPAGGLGNDHSTDAK